MRGLSLLKFPMWGFGRRANEEERLIDSISHHGDGNAFLVSAPRGVYRHISPWESVDIYGPITREDHSNSTTRDENGKVS